MQSINQHLTLAPGETTTMQFDMTNIVYDWRYFARAYFYSGGSLRPLIYMTTYTIVFPKIRPGDVNGDGSLTIADIANLVAIIMGDAITNYDLKAADVNQDGLITIADVSGLVDIILGKTE